MLELGAKKWPYRNWYSRAPTYALAVSHPGNDHDDSSHLPADSEQLWCFCQQPESGKMIACDHVQLVWLHKLKEYTKETGIAESVERSSLSVKEIFNRAK